MKTPVKLKSLLLAGAMLVTSLFTHAEDIDLYTGGEQVTGSSANVLIVLDNSTNWAAQSQRWSDGATQGVAELETLIEVLSSLTDDINVGLMTFAQAGGGNVRYTVREMNDGNRSVLSQIFEQIKAENGGAIVVEKGQKTTGRSSDEVASDTNYDNLMHAAFRYFNGLQRHQNAQGNYLDLSGNFADRRDWNGNANNFATSKKPSSPQADSYSLDNASAANYNPPVQAKDGCAKNFIIFIGNGFPSNIGDATELTQAAALIGKTADTSPIVAISPKNPIADEWARFMFKEGVKVSDTQSNKVVTYTIDVCKDACETSQETLLSSMANVGGGRYFRSTSKDEIRRALSLIFSEIQAVNSQFAAAALPVSVNARGTFENQVYIGVFRPDANALPRWYGNLKGYKFGGFCDWNQNGIVESGEPITDAVGNNSDACRKYCDFDNDGAVDPGEGINDPVGAEAACVTLAAAAGGSALLKSLPIERYDIFLSDRNGKIAEDQITGNGFITQEATSFWSHPSSFWNFLPTTASGVSDTPDGPNVERGGAAQRLRDQLECQAADGTPSARISGATCSAIYSPTVPVRRVYTCLSCTSTLDSFSPDNTALTNPTTGRLARTTDVYTLTSLTRVGDTVTVAAAGHTFQVGDEIKITEATPSAYNLNPVTVASVVSGTSFTFTLAGLEKPSTSAAGKGTTSAARTVTSLQVNLTEAKAYLDTSGYAVGDQVDIAGAAQSKYFNGVSTVTSLGSDSGGNFLTYSLKSLPVSPASNPGSTNAGGGFGTQSNESVVRDPSDSTRIVVTFPAAVSGLGLDSGSGSLKRNSRFEVGDVVTVSGVAPVDYEGDQKIVPCAAQSQKTYCFRLPVSPNTGTSITATRVVDPFDVALSRTLGSTTVTALVSGKTLAEAGIVSGGKVKLSGTGQVDYDKSFTVASVNVAANSFTFTLPSLSPANGTAGKAQLRDYVPPQTLVSWILGKENGTEDENRDGHETGKRASVHGDVLHSRPLMMNYDDPATDATEIGVVGFYGANDGFLRAIKAGTADADGYEIWSFIPEEFIPDERSPATSNTGLNRLYFNEVPIRYPNSAAGMTPTPQKRTYFWDGVITTNSVALEQMGNKRIIYAVMRRGGRALYALDVTNPTGNADPANLVPQLAWKLSNLTLGFEKLGQTWSEPKVVLVKAGAGDTQTSVPLLVMGGGFDPTEDDLPPGSARGNVDETVGLGRGIYLINPATGPTEPPIDITGNNKDFLHLNPNLGGTAKSYSVPADVTPVDTDGDGHIDRIYAVDSGGNLLRWTWKTGSTNPYDEGSWDFKHVANLEESGTESARRFLSRAAFMPSTLKGTLTGYTLLFGSGDREKPLPNFYVDKDTLQCVPSKLPVNANYYSDAYFGPQSGDKTKVVQDRFYAIFDVDDPSVFTHANLQPIIQSGTVVEFDFDDGGQSKTGWYFDLVNNEIKRRDENNVVIGECTYGEEKLVDTPVFSGGYVRFATNSPQLPDPKSQQCSNLGQAREYALNPLTGLADGVTSGSTFNVNNFSTVLDGGGFAPSITSGVVQIGERFVKFDTRGAGGTGRDPVHASTRRNKVYWYFQAD